MANEEQVALLKRSVIKWNRWREENKLAVIDLRKANLSGINLSGAYLSGAILEEADLTRADLSKVKLHRANLSRTNLSESKILKSDLLLVKFHYANLAHADFSYTELAGCDFAHARLDGTIVGGTKFLDTDLSAANGLEEVRHRVLSFIDTRTIRSSKGNIPTAFLRGCGLSDWEIESSKLYNPDLTNEQIVKIQSRIYELRATQALQISPLFISYSHADKPLVDRLDSALTQKGIRFWRDIHDATAGRLETQIDRAIRQNPTVLLVLSKNSIKSDWVEHEVRTARQLEKELGRDALCPIALDDGWKSSPWPKRVMEQVMEYNILDFSDWDDKSAFEGKFAKLLSGLDLFYKKA